MMCVERWKLCESICRVSTKSKSPFTSSRIFSEIRKLWNSTRKSREDKKGKNKGQIVPEGYFPVYVGSEKQRFLIRIECSNHPLFRMLLEDAQKEYGHKSEGPLLLPCDADYFHKVLAEIDIQGSISTTTAQSSCGLFSPFNSFCFLGSSKGTCSAYAFQAPL